MTDHPICVVGTGYVGMACLIGFADVGFRVHGYDIVPERIESLRAGIAQYREAGIEASLRRHLGAGNIRVFSSLAEAASSARLIILTVGTPCRDDGSTDLSALYAAIDSLSRIRFESRPTFVVRSTVPPGTSDDLGARVKGIADVIVAPEFLREGSAVSDLLNPDRIVVGAEHPDAADDYLLIYRRMNKPTIITSRRNAEFIKCGANAYLALKISFANEVANLCDALGATADDVLRGIGTDSRIGPDFLRPGIGFGGPCFEKDVKGIAYTARRHGVPHELFAATLRVNERQPYRIADLLREDLGSLAGASIGVWGLAFKAGTDDVRDSLAIRVISDIVARGATIRAYDPAVQSTWLPANAKIVSSALKAADADALVILTEWPEFAAIDPVAVRARLRRGVVIDGRNILDPVAYAAAGLRYRGIGRPSALPALTGTYEPELLVEAI